MAHRIAGLGWIPDVPDRRDLVYAAPSRRAVPLPPAVDLRPGCPPVQDQGALGSCTAHALGAAVAYSLGRGARPVGLTPSRLFIYYNERLVEGTVRVDAGAQLRNGIKVLQKYGAPPEALWPYSDSNPGPFQQRPRAGVFRAAAKHQVTSYHRIARVLDVMRGCLAEGFPFVFGVAIYDSFLGDATARTGAVALPGAAEGLLGGHAMLAVGYDDATQRVAFRNSWGATWGDQGYGTIPYAYLLDGDLAADFWTVRTVEG